MGSLITYYLAIGCGVAFLCITFRYEKLKGMISELYEGDFNNQIVFIIVVVFTIFTWPRIFHIKRVAKKE